MVDELVLPTGERAFPVGENGRVVGLLALRDNQVPVVEGGRLLGLVRREGVLGWLSLHGNLPPGVLLTERRSPTERSPYRPRVCRPGSPVLQSKE